MIGLKIHNPGVLTTIQDIGRVGYGCYGIPTSGVMDSLSLHLGNILVGNDRYEAALEITLMGPEIEFMSNLIIAITGADISPTINGREIEMYSTIYVNKGDVLRFGNLKGGCRAYMTVSGGFDVTKLMDSKSTYLRGKLGGFEGRRLKRGDVISVNLDKSHRYLGLRKIPKNLIPIYKNQYTARVILGPELDRFTLEGINTFLSSKYTLTNQCDRMGYRLKGPRIQHDNGADIISGGITLGAIQVPGHGEPIIMMTDRQTTGGYTKIANVISVDIPFLAQLKAGDKLKFERIDINDAQKLLREEYKSLSKIIENFEESMVKRDIKRIRSFSIKVNGKKYNIGVQEFT